MIQNMAEIETKQAEVVAQKNKIVGSDEAEARTVKPDVNTGSAKAQVAPARESDAKTVPVHETHVRTDEVVTDPSSPEAVQVPDAGRGALDLPVHRLAEGTPEEVFAAEASEADEPDEDE